MQVDQPLCYDCIHRVQDEVEVSIREAQQECAAYEAALARLREDDTQPYTDEVGSACRTAPASASAIMFACTVLSLHLDLLRNCVCCISQPYLSIIKGMLGCTKSAGSSMQPRGPCSIMSTQRSYFQTRQLVI